MMRTMMKSLPLLVLLPMFLASCATTEITNLTPNTYPRNPTGQYLVEMQIDTTEQTYIPSSVTNWVVVGFDSYPMRRTKRTENRWEGFIPVPASKEIITYHFKSNFELQSFGKTRSSSINSKEYTLAVK